MWPIFLDDDRASVARGRARAIAARLRCPDQVADARARTQAAASQYEHWLPFTLSRGDAGITLLHGWLDACFPGEDWDRVAHAYLTSAAHDAGSMEQVPLGLLDGSAGLAFTACYLSRDGSRYQRLLASLETALLPQMAAVAGVFERRTEGLHTSEFDVVSGLSGMAGYLLCRTDSEAAMATLRSVVRAMIALSREDDAGPLWRTPPGLLNENLRDYYPSGSFNCGLAHGAPGLLAALALAHRGGIGIDELPEAIRRVSEWLLGARVEDDWGITWPAAVAFNGGAAGPVYCRDTWCYGGPGVARALWLAGEALGEDRYREVALESMKGVLRRPMPRRGISSPTFCHGVAGLLQIAMRFAHDSGCRALFDGVVELYDQLESHYEPGTLFGYRNVEEGDLRTDHPGFLEGAPGVAAVLLAATSGVEPKWDRAFLLS
jgi:hypothetical protein